MKNPNKVKMGKKSRAQGKQFELRVRKDLEEKGWIVDRWGNNVEFGIEKHNMIVSGNDNKYEIPAARLVPAKAKWSGPNRPMMMSGGFPDFVCFKIHDLSNPQTYHIQFVECKTNGYLDKKEVEKCRWLQGEGFNILIAEKTKVKNKVVIVYHDFWEKYGNKN